MSKPNAAEATKGVAMIYCWKWDENDSDCDLQKDNHSTGCKSKAVKCTQVVLKSIALISIGFKNAESERIYIWNFRRYPVAAF